MNFKFTEQMALSVDLIIFVFTEKVTKSPKVKILLKCIRVHYGNTDTYELCYFLLFKCITFQNVMLSASLRGSLYPNTRPFKENATQ